MIAFLTFAGLCAGLVLGVRFGAGALEWALRLLSQYSSGPRSFPSRPTSRLG